MARESYANAKTLHDPGIPDTTLSAGINAVTTSIPLTSLTNLPAAAPFCILIGDELILVTVRAIPATGTRGIEGTTAAIHASGAAVFHVLTARGLLAATVGGLQIEGVANPITITGGDDGGGNTAIVFDNPTDSYIALNFAQQAVFTGAVTISLRSLEGSVNLLGGDSASRGGAALEVASGEAGGSIAFQAGFGIDGDTNGGSVSLAAGAGFGAGVGGDFQIILHGGAFTAVGASGYSFDGALKAGAYQSSDGSPGITGGPYTSVTVKNGLVVVGT